MKQAITGTGNKAIAKAYQAETVESMPQFLRITVGGDPFVLTLGVVREILQVGAMTPVPMAPSFVRGVMNLRGAVVPVIDLNARFRLQGIQLTARSCIVIVDAPQGESSPREEQAIGLLVDSVQEVVDVAENNLAGVPELGTRVPANFLSGVARVREVLSPVLSLPHILDTSQLAILIGRFSTLNKH